LLFPHDAGKASHWTGADGFERAFDPQLAAFSLLLKPVFDFQPSEVEVAFENVGILVSVLGPMTKLSISTPSRSSKETAVGRSFCCLGREVGVGEEKGSVT
jgi:hypothetical protein